VDGSISPEKRKNWKLIGRGERRSQPRETLTQSGRETMADAPAGPALNSDAADDCTVGNPAEGAAEVQVQGKTRKPSEFGRGHPLYSYCKQVADVSLAATDNKQNFITKDRVRIQGIRFSAPSPYALASTDEHGLLDVSSSAPFFSGVKSLMIWSPRRQFGASLTATQQ
jgi:hypothetical protein